MCGIVGLLQKPGAASELAGHDIAAWLSQATDALIHRGPDSGGELILDHVAIGARRLRIHDLSSKADQPLLSEDGRYAIVFNGAIFNYRQLRTELEARGFTFRTSGDTEVALNAIIAWGRDAFVRFDGMYAIGFLDRRSKSLLVGRDKLGIKPLFICRRSDFVAFSSEIKPLLAHPSINRRVNRKAVAAFMAFQFVAPPDTLFEGIETLPPGA